MTTITRYLENILSHLKRLGHPITSLLQDGLPRTALDHKLRGVSVRLPSEIADFYSWRNGTDVHPGDPLNRIHFFPGYYFLSIEDAISSYNSFRGDDRWDKRWFPLFANGGGDFYAIVCADDMYESGEIVCFLLGIPKDELLIEFESLEKMLETISACYDEGVFYARPDGYLDAHDDRYVALVRTLNPHLESYDNL